jgi:hypothetical protein
MMRRVWNLCEKRNSVEYFDDNVVRMTVTFVMLTVRINVIRTSYVAPKRHLPVRARTCTLFFTRHAYPYLYTFMRYIELLARY